MRVITFGRTVVVPLSVVVVALAGLSAPPVAVRSVVVILLAVAAIGLMLALTRWGHRSRPRLPLAPFDGALETARDDASDLARMGSDAG